MGRLQNRLFCFPPNAIFHARAPRCRSNLFHPENFENPVHRVHWIIHTETKKCVYAKSNGNHSRGPTPTLILCHLINQRERNNADKKKPPSPYPSTGQPTRCLLLGAVNIHNTNTCGVHVHARTKWAFYDGSRVKLSEVERRRRPRDGTMHADPYSGRCYFRSILSIEEGRRTTWRVRSLRNT